MEKFIRVLMAYEEVHGLCIVLELKLAHAPNCCYCSFYLTFSICPNTFIWIIILGAMSSFVI